MKNRRKRNFQQFSEDNDSSLEVVKKKRTLKKVDDDDYESDFIDD